MSPPQARSTGPGSSSSPKAAFSGAKSSKPIDGQYIVIFEDKVRNAPSHAQNLVSAHGGENIHTYQHALKGFAAKKLPQQAAEAIEKNPNVKRVVQDVEGHLTDTQSNPPWGLDRIDQRTNNLGDTYKYDATGQGVTVYVLDSGVRISHDQFGGRASYGYDAVDNDNVASDCLGHGTHVAGTIAGSTYGVAKNANIVAVRVADCDRSVSGSDYIAGIDWIIANANSPSVANASLSLSSGPAVESATQELIDAGIGLAAAAGNNNGYDACNILPAGVADVMTIGATNRDDERADFSNVGSCIDWFAPGVDVLSAERESDSDTDRKDGTSMASPHSAGVAALYLEDHSSASPQQVQNALLNATTKNVVADAQSANDHLLYNLYTRPPSAYISGPTQVNEGEQGTWTVSASGGSGNYSYSWQKRVSQDSPWYGACAGAETSCTTSFEDNAFGDAYANIRVFVSDESSGKQDIAKTDVVVKEDADDGDDDNGDGGGCENDTDLNYICP